MIIDGKKVSQIILDDLALKIKDLKNNSLATPKLAAVLVGNNSASQVYVKNKIIACEKVGILSEEHILPENTTEHGLLDLIKKLNLDPTTTGILVQLPLPQHIDKNKIIDAILPSKDVDGFHPYNLGRLAAKNPLIHPCTPKGVMKLIEHYKIDVCGKNIVIIGSSVIVGTPMALELMMANATVTICNSKTCDLNNVTKNADIIISAAGVPKLIKKDHIKKDAIIFDIGINRLDDGKIVGDVDFDNIKDIASMITPVPGGVGPMTVAMLMENCYSLAIAASKI